MFDLKTFIRPALVAVSLAAMSSAASAATIKVFDLSPGVDPTVAVADTGVITSAGVAGSFATSGMTYNVTVTPTDGPGQSILNTISVTTKGAGKIGILVSEDDFAGGARAPLSSNLRFSLSATSVGKALSGTGYVDDGNTLEAMTDTIGSMISFTTPFVAGFATDTRSDSAVLAAPFSMTAYYVVEHDGASDITSFDSTAIAAVPVPAAGGLLLMALGGLGLARRKRKAA